VYLTPEEYGDSLLIKRKLEGDEIQALSIAWTAVSRKLM
jgi:hypothetical protein